MPHPLNVKIGALRRRARRLLVVHGVSCTVAVCLFVAVLAALGDYFFRYEERGIRFASSAAVALVVAWTVRRYLWPALRFPLDSIFLARQIERKYPVLRERLSGAVAFLNTADDEPSAGSPQLRHTVIHETTQDALRLPLTEVVRRRPVVYAAAVASLVVAAAAALWGTHREVASIASLRLLKPWGDDAWPQTNHLKFLNPVNRLAYGHRFRAELVDEHGAEIPGDVTIQFRRRPEDKEIERSAMRQEGEVWTAERAKVTHDFAYRAVGGDDRSMPWIDVQVVEPAEVREVRWKVHYPPYTQWKALDTGPRPADQNALTSALPAGSSLEIWARSNKPLRSAMLRLDGETSLAAKLDPDQLGFSLSLAGGNAWNVAKSQSFRWELIGEDGFQGGDEIRRELLVEADPPPWVKLPKPQAAPEDPRGDIYVTPMAAVAVQVQTGDAFAVRPGTALREVSLRFNRSDRSAEGDQTVPLHAGPAKLVPAEADAPSNLREEELRTLEYLWDLKPLALQPGTIVTLFAAASDYQPQERTSESRRLRVVSPDEFLERLNERQRALHAELNKLRTKQATARQQVQEAVAQANKAPLADQKAAEAARRALNEALNLQRDVAVGLGLARRPDRPQEQQAQNREGVQSRVASMLEDLRANRIDNREVESRLTDIAAELTEVEQQDKPHEIADRLAEALKANPQDTAQRNEAAAALADAGEKQESVTESLDAMLRNLTQWDDYGKFHEELARMKREQEQVAAETLEHMRRQLKNDGKSGETAQQRQEASARKREELAGRQAAIARRFEQMQQNMRRQREAGDQTGAEALDRALRAADEANPSGAMREAGQMLRDDQLGKAPERQQEALRKIGEVMQALSAQKLDELNRLVSKLKAAESELDQLKQAQKSLKSKLQDANKLGDEAERKQELQRLAKQQRDLQMKTQQLAEQLKRLKAQRSAGRTAQGSGRMSGAGQAAEQGEGQTAEEQAAAAERDLENAQRELAEERRQAESDLAREAAAKLQDDIKAFIARQQRVVDETKRYETLRQTGALTRAAQIGILDLAEEQESLEMETRASGERLGSAPAFKLALDGAAQEMTLTAQALRERRTDERTQRTAGNAVRRYQQLLDAIKPRTAKKQDGQQPGEGSGGAGGGGSGGGETPTSLAELVLIKLMQEDVNARTKELDALRKQTRLSPEEAAEFQRLGDEQGKLADLLLDLVGEQEAPEAGPDLDLKDLDLRPAGGDKSKPGPGAPRQESRPPAGDAPPQDTE